MAANLFAYTGDQKKWNKPRLNFKEGDLILLKDSSIVKNQWSCGRISKIIPNKDGKVHCLEIIRPDGTILSRDIQNVCKLEVDLEWWNVCLCLLVCVFFIVCYDLFVWFVVNLAWFWMNFSFLLVDWNGGLNFWSFLFMRFCVHFLGSVSRLTVSCDKGGISPH